MADSKTYCLNCGHTRSIRGNESGERYGEACFGRDWFHGTYETLLLRLATEARTTFWRETPLPPRRIRAGDRGRRN